MDLELKGKTAIITGGSRGIGKAIAREFGREGVDVALVSRGQETLDSTAKELAEETGGRFYTADTMDSLVDDIQTVGGGVTVIEERDLWDMPALLFVFLVLVLGEWGYRRARGLA